MWTDVTRDCMYVLELCRHMNEHEEYHAEFIVKSWDQFSLNGYLALMTVCVPVFQAWFADKIAEEQFSHGLYIRIVEPNFESVQSLSHRFPTVCDETVCPYVCHMGMQVNQESILAHGIIPPKPAGREIGQVMNWFYGYDLQLILGEALEVRSTALSVEKTSLFHLNAMMTCPGHWKICFHGEMLNSDIVYQIDTRLLRTSMPTNMERDAPENWLLTGAGVRFSKTIVSYSAIVRSYDPRSGNAFPVHCASRISPSPGKASPGQDPF